MIESTRELAWFVEVVRHGSLSAAARALQITPSAVSKAIGRLEVQLGVRVLERSTHRVQATAEGELLYARAVGILEAVREAEAALSELRGLPRGRLAVNASAPIMLRWVVPALPAFRARYPDVELDLQVADAVVDLIEARVDVALRVGPLPDSSLRARRLFTNRRVVVGGPGYLQARGRPAHPEELSRHDCLLFDVGAERLNRWTFREVGTVPVTGPLRSPSGEALRAMALADLGLARLGRFLVADDLAAGRLEEVLSSFAPEDGEPVHAVYLGEGPVPMRVRAFVDHMASVARGG